MVRSAYFLHATISLLFILGSASCFAQPFQVGHTAITFIDGSRNNRQIPSEIYYPALAAGEEVPVAPGQFPVLSYGHGFVMTVDAYGNYIDALVPLGYIFVLPDTETGFSPSHNDLALDLAFVIQSMALENNDPGSLFYGAVAGVSAVMGHSMGGGASMLAAAADPSITAVVNHAAANTSPSAIGAASNITVPVLMFAGSEDCVTPPSQHQQPMYDSLASDCKTLVTITGGGHCYFANYNLLCTIGENSCAPNLTITREEQQQTVLTFMVPWLDFILRGNYASWQTFLDSLESSQKITYQHQCQQTAIPGIETGMTGLKVFPVPFRDYLVIDGTAGSCSVKVFDLNGREVHSGNLPDDGSALLSLDSLRPGIYQLVLMNGHGALAVKRIFKF